MRVWRRMLFQMEMGLQCSLLFGGGSLSFVQDVPASVSVSLSGRVVGGEVAALCFGEGRMCWSDGQGIAFWRRCGGYVWFFSRCCDGGGVSSGGRGWRVVAVDGYPHGVAALRAGCFAASFPYLHVRILSADGTEMQTLGTPGEKWTDRLHFDYPLLCDAALVGADRDDDRAVMFTGAWWCPVRVCVC